MVGEVITEYLRKNNISAKMRGTEKVTDILLYSLTCIDRVVRCSGRTSIVLGALKKPGISYWKNKNNVDDKNNDVQKERRRNNNNHNINNNVNELVKLLLTLAI